MSKWNIQIGQKTHKISPILFGLFLEDISFTCDGGLNSNMINNHSFDGVYMERSYTQRYAVRAKIAPRLFPERLRYWEISNGRMESACMDPASEKNPWYARITAGPDCCIYNRGFNGGQENRGKCAVTIAKDHSYSVSLYLRSANYTGKVIVSVISEENECLTETVEFLCDDQWNRYEELLNGRITGRGRLEIKFDGTGVVDIDCVSLSDTDVWRKDDTRWTGGHFRRDLVETLAELKPKFLRFPGGCIVEGGFPGNEYRWKNTIGPLIDRIPSVSLWAAAFEEKGYCQSYQIGFYEFFLLCESLGIEPLPIVWAGINCQFRSTEVLRTESTEFVKEVIDNALDLIEFANGDPAKNKWAKLRADSGHPEPFGMKMIGIGNENFGPDYFEKFAVVKKEIQNRYPEIICILSAGGEPEGKEFDAAWSIAKEKFRDVRIDEHFYKDDKWFYGQVNRYDHYERDGAKVFVGEYAANNIRVLHKTNTFGSALAEAAFLTGIEKNSDVVEMISYAPLFAMSEGMQWSHNLIWFNPEYILKTPNYYVQQMFGAHIGEYYFKAEGGLPEHTYLSVTGDNEKYYIKLVNAGESEQTVSFRFCEPVVQKGAYWSLHSDDLEAANELAFIGSPVYQIQPESGTLSYTERGVTCRLLPYSINVYEILKRK